MTTFRAKAPLRVGFAGGGTDVEPYCNEFGGCVLNATINKYAYTTLEITNMRNIEIHSIDYNYIAEYHVDEDLVFDGNMDLAKGVIRRLKNGNSDGIRIVTHNDAPPGSGLGSSSAMVVSLLGAFKEWQRLPIGGYELAALAHEIERKDLGILGGQQDQYAAVFGGFNFMEFNKNYVLVNPLRIDPFTVFELEYNMLLFYTGTSRLSAHIIEAQVENVGARKASSMDAMHDIKQQAHDMKRALLTGNVDDFGKLLDDAWHAKKRMATQISNSSIDEVYEEAIKAGAIGGKVSGAGGGGFMLFYCEGGKKYKVAERLNRMGGEVVDFQFEPKGLQSWSVPSSEALARKPGMFGDHPQKLRVTG